MSTIQSAEEFARQLRLPGGLGYEQFDDGIALITARDAALRAEEREACAQVAFRHKAVQGLARVSIGEAIRARDPESPATAPRAQRATP